MHSDDIIEVNNTAQHRYFLIKNEIEGVGVYLNYMDHLLERFNTEQENMQLDEDEQKYVKAIEKYCNIEKKYSNLETRFKKIKIKILHKKKMLEEKFKAYETFTRLIKEFTITDSNEHFLIVEKDILYEKFKNYMLTEFNSEFKNYLDSIRETFNEIKSVFPRYLNKAFVFDSTEL